MDARLLNLQASAHFMVGGALGVVRGRLLCLSDVNRGGR